MKKKSEKVEKNKKELRSMENYEEDFLTYSVERMCDQKTTKDDREMTKDLLYHASHIIYMFSFKEVVGFMANAEDLMNEFENNFGSRYDRACDCCKDKIEKGELKKNGDCDCDGTCDDEGCQ